MKRTLADVRPELINEWSQRNLPLSLSGQVLLICYKYYIQNNKFFNNEKKNLPCNKLFLYNPPYHKHIEARMLMVRKTAKQFYIRNTLSSALQGLTSVFGMGTGGPPASSTPTVDSEYSFGSPSWTRTNDNSVNSRMLWHTAVDRVMIPRRLSAKNSSIIDTLYAHETAGQIALSRCRYHDSVL